MSSSIALSFPAQEVRRHDRDRFIGTLFAPSDRRDDLCALYAFNLEIARVREAVREPMMGRVRLQWWRDTLEAIYSGAAPPKHPVAEPLAEAIKGRGLSRLHFERLLDAREADMNDEPPADLAALEDYAEGTSAALTALALEVLDAADEPSRQAGRHAGIAFALAGLLRAVPFHAAAGRLYLPADLLERHGVKAHAVLAAKPSDGLRRVAEEVAALAARHLAEARRAKAARRAVPALVQAAMADDYLSRLRKAGFDVFHPGVARARPNLLRVTAKGLLGRY